MRKGTAIVQTEKSMMSLFASCIQKRVCNFSSCLYSVTRDQKNLDDMGVTHSRTLRFKSVLRWFLSLQCQLDKQIVTGMS